MDSTLISKVVFYLRTIQYRMGHLAVLGLLMLLAAIVIYFSLSLPQTRHLRSIEATYSKLSMHHAQTVKLQIPQQSLSTDAFFKELPNVAQKDAALKTIVVIAEKNILPLTTGKYETLTKEAGQLVFYQISFPLKGSFPQIKQFLADTLNTLPYAALSQLYLRHATVESNQIEANVIFTLYFYKPALR